MVELPAVSVDIPKNLAHFIYITGCDGTGKTTQAALLVEKLQTVRRKVRRVWLRFPFLFSLPLLAYARWRGLSWYEQSGDVRFGYWDFSHSKILQTVLPWTLYFDAFLAGLIKIQLPLWKGETVICERFVLDMLVDLNVAFNQRDVHKRLPGKRFLRLIPRDALIFILDLDADTIRRRRENLRADRRLEERLEAYRVLSNDLSLKQFSSTMPIHDLNNLIFESAISPPPIGGKIEN